MRVKYSDPEAMLPLYTREPFQPVKFNHSMDQSSLARQRPQRGLPKPSLSSKLTHVLNDGDITTMPHASDAIENPQTNSRRRQLTRISDLKNHGGNDDTSASNSPHQRSLTRMSEPGVASRPTRSSTICPDQILNSSNSKAVDKTSKPLTYSASDMRPALIRFTDELLDRNEFTTVEQIGDDLYIVTGINWRWETSFPVTTSGNLRTLIHTVEDNTCPSSQPIREIAHLNRGSAIRTSDKGSESTLEEVPDLTMGSSPPQQPSQSPPPRSTHKQLLTPRPSSGRVLKPVAKLREMEAARRTRTKISRDSESSWASDVPSEFDKSAAPESNASGLKIQLRKTSPAPSGIKLYLKRNGSTPKEGRGARARGNDEQEDERDEETEDDPDIIVTRASKRARFVKT